MRGSMLVVAASWQLAASLLGETIDFPALLTELAAGSEPSYALPLVSKGILPNSPKILRSRERCGKVSITLCENWNELTQAIPCQVESSGFVTGWKPEVGLNEYFRKEGYVYVLVTFTSPAEAIKLRSVMVQPSYYSKELTDLSQAKQFINTHGSHFVSAVTRGDALYQVFVYRESKYKALKRKLSQDITKHEVNKLLSPIYTVAIGPVRSVSGKANEKWLRKTLLTKLMFFSYPNLLEVTRNQRLLPLLLPAMSSSSLLSVSLSKIEKLLPPSSKKFISEAVDNNLLLHQENLNR